MSGEAGHLLAVIGGERQGGSIAVGANNRALLDSAMCYVRTHSPDQFPAEAAPILTAALKLFVMMNIVGSALSDGKAEREEQEFLDKMQKASASATTPSSRTSRSCTPPFYANWRA